MSDLLVENVILPDGDQGDVLILGGVIDRIGPGLIPPPGTPRLQGRGRLAIPGGVDMHVHFRTPGGEHKETLLTGALAAAKGGITTVGDMPNTSPPTTTLARLEEKIALAAGAAVQVLFNFGAEPGQVGQLDRAAAHPRVKAVKVYLGPTTGTGGVVADVADEYFQAAARLDLPVMVHAEDPALIQAAAGFHPPEAAYHHLLRPAEAELSSVRRALNLAARHGNRLYLCHITQAEVVELVEQSPIRDRVFVEVSPHHLLLSTQNMDEPLPNRLKVNPPLREEAQRQALWAMLAGRVDGLGSDHAPHTLAEKELPYSQAPSGLPGVEYLLPLALDWWASGEFDLARMAALTSGNVSRFLRLNKGRLAPGLDGDLVLVNTESRWHVAQGDDRVVSKCGWTPYAGRLMRTRPEVTVAGGRVVYSLK
ncbi:MAG: dihydroorotase family protein, partial [Deltaproteobacteria bacterium]|nr:dihydroorotase family protein [Deltaproteobacteria bacterium]